MLETSILHTGSYGGRCLTVKINEKVLATPTYFPSISSAATRMQLIPLIRECMSSGYPRLLISAYDIFNDKEESKKLIQALNDFLKKGNILFLDSGTFEKYWLQNYTWSYSNYESVIKQTTSDFYASFDEIPSPSDDNESLFKKLLPYVKKSVKLEKNNHCITICQGLTPKQLTNLTSKICNQTEEFSQMIAIPERYCGKTLKERVNTIKKIRKILNDKNENNILHVLGCGNPLSIALFSFVGADSFDSVDWSRWLINRNTLTFTDKTHLSLLNCSCNACSLSKVDTGYQELLHNLLFYQTFLNEVKYAIQMHDEINFLARYYDPTILSKIVNFF